MIFCWIIEGKSQWGPWWNICTRLLTDVKQTQRKVCSRATQSTLGLLEMNSVALTITFIRMTPSNTKLIPAIVKAENTCPCTIQSAIYQSTGVTLTTGHSCHRNSKRCCNRKVQWWSQDCAKHQCHNIAYFKCHIRKEKSRSACLPLDHWFYACFIPHRDHNPNEAGNKESTHTLHQHNANSVSISCQTE